MKRLLKILGIILLLLIPGFFCLGLIQPEIRYTSEITIEKPLRETFRKYNDIGLLKKWIPGMQSVEILDFNPGLVGSKLKMNLETEGRKMEITELVTAYTEDSLLALEIDAGIMTKQNKMEFIARNESTIIKGTYSCRGSNVFYRSLLVLFGYKMKDLDAASLNNFKTFIEH